MTRRALLGLLGLLLCGAVAAQQGPRVAQHEVRNEGTRVVLAWTMEQEATVAAFEIHRRTPTSTGFVLLHTLASHGPGKPYGYTDATLYKETSALAEYAIWAVQRDGTRVALFSEQVNYTTTGIRRTWGSLKAMFQ